MNIVITGAQGSLGQELVLTLQEEHTVVPLSRFNMDITDIEEVQSVLSSFEIDCIIHCAAITTWPGHLKDKAEEIVFQVNTAGTAHIAAYAQSKNIPLLHLSCASVLSPVDAIGQSKKEAEDIIQQLSEAQAFPYRILRTGFLFGPYGHSLVQNIARLIKKKKSITAVDDIIYSFSSTTLVASYVQGLLKDVQSWEGEIEHCCYKESLSVAELAEMIVKIQGKDVLVNKVSADSQGEQALNFTMKSSKNCESLEDALRAYL